MLAYCTSFSGGAGRTFYVSFTSPTQVGMRLILGCTLPQYAYSSIHSHMHSVYSARLRGAYQSFYRGQSDLFLARVFLSKPFPLFVRTDIRPFRLALVEFIPIHFGLLPWQHDLLYGISKTGTSDKFSGSHRSVCTHHVKEINPNSVSFTIWDTNDR